MWVSKQWWEQERLYLEGARAAAVAADEGGGGGGGGRGGRSIRELKREDYKSFKYHIGTESSVPVAPVLVLEHHRPTMSMLWGHGGRSKREK